VLPVNVPGAGHTPAVGACGFERVIVLDTIPEPLPSSNGFDVIVTEGVLTEAGTLIVPFAGAVASSVTVTFVVLVLPAPSVPVNVEVDENDALVADHP
jgi:hypothetical protein